MLKRKWMYMVRRMLIVCCVLCSCVAGADAKALPSLVLRSKESGQYVFLNRIAYPGADIARHPKAAIVLSFMGVDCIPCRKELPIFDEIAQSMKDEEGIRFFIVSTDSLKRVKALDALIEKLDLNAEVLLDPYKVATKKLGVNGLPTLVIIDADGTVQSIHSGFNGDAEKYRSDVLDWVQDVSQREGKE